MQDLPERVWPGWGRTPGDVLFVTGEGEFLLNTQAHPEGFTVTSPTPPLGGSAQVRARTFPATFLATFPAFGAAPTIVVGRAEATGKTSTTWVLTLMHEHFHQLQYSDPGYFKETQALDLSGGDESGMWMLNYPFPYEASSAAFAALSRRLADLVETPAPRLRDAFWSVYAAFCAQLQPKDYRYLSLQLWQEGISRYAELRAAEAAARGRRVPGSFSSLPDYQPYATAAADLRAGILNGLRRETMAADKRVVFYAFGAGLGLLLDQEKVAWKERYLARKFYLEKYRLALR